MVNPKPCLPAVAKSPQNMIRHVMKVPPGDISNVEIVALYQHLDRDRSGAVEVAELLAFVHGTLDQIHERPKTPPRRPWGGSGDKLPTPANLLPTWQKPQAPDKYQPTLELTSLIQMKHRHLKPAVQGLVSPVKPQRPRPPHRDGGGSANSGSFLSNVTTQRTEPRHVMGPRAWLVEYR